LSVEVIELNKISWRLVKEEEALKGSALGSGIVIKESKFKAATEVG